MFLSVCVRLCVFTTTTTRVHDISTTTTITTTETRLDSQSLAMAVQSASAKALAGLLNAAAGQPHVQHAVPNAIGKNRVVNRRLKAKTSQLVSQPCTHTVH